MNARWAALFAAAALTLAPAGARADSFDPISVGLHIGTLGYGITLERPLLFDLSARIETGNMSLSGSSTYDGTSFTQTQHFANVLTALAWRPQALRFGISAGLLFSADHVDYSAVPTAGAYTINGNTYTVANAGRLMTRVDLSQPALYFGLGSNTGVYRGLILAINAGVVIRNGIASTSATGPAAQTPALQTDLTHLNGEFRTHIVSPAISVGLTYRP
jgi:acyl transferase domain-containing protein